MTIRSMSRLQKCIGRKFTGGLAEWFDIGTGTPCITRAYLCLGSWVSLVCSEETISVYDEEITPIIGVNSNYRIDLIPNCYLLLNMEVVKIYLLEDTKEITRGVEFVFDKGLNMTLYNEGYEAGDIMVLKVNDSNGFYSKRMITP